MALRVRHGASELILPSKEVLTFLYRRRQVAPFDLVWHPGQKRWVRVDAFLFIDGKGPGSAEEPLG